MKKLIDERIKTFYENRTRYYLPRKTYTIIRCDGRSFHTYTRGLERPFDMGLVNDMDETAIYLCKNIQGAKLAFVQSDEISIVMTDFETINTDAWFDGNIQKMASVSASMVTAKFNQLRLIRKMEMECSSGIAYNSLDVNDIRTQKLAEFDSRVFTIPQPEEVYNYMQWRQQDCVRNSISSTAQSLYSHKDLNGKNQSDMQEMCWQKGVNWNDFDGKLKNGRLIVKKEVTLNTPFIGEEFKQSSYTRNVWQSIAAPTFTQSKDYLRELINGDI